MPRIVGCVLGHSFVASLHSHLSSCSSSRQGDARPRVSDRYIPETRKLISPQQIAVELRLDDLVDAFHLMGTRGAKITNSNFELPLRDLVQSRSDFVIINYGTNDLVSGISPLTVATKVLDIAKTLLRRVPTVKHIIICSAVNRQATINNRNFDEVAFDFDNYLYHLCDVEDDITYHVHKGFWKSQIEDWSRDGIHPNTARGRQLYKRSMRSATFKALKCVTWINQL